MDVHVNGARTQSSVTAPGHLMPSLSALRMSDARMSPQLICAGATRLRSGSRCAQTCGMEGSCCDRERALLWSLPTARTSSRAAPAYNENRSKKRSVPRDLARAHAREHLLVEERRVQLALRLHLLQEDRLVRQRPGAAARLIPWPPATSNGRRKGIVEMMGTARESLQKGARHTPRF